KQQNNSSAIQGSFVLYSIGMLGGTGNDYGDLLVGRMASFYQETQVPRGDWRFWNFEAYVQDTWKPRPDLTLELSAHDPAQGTFVDRDTGRPNGVLLASRGEIPKGMTPDPGLKAMP